MEDKKMANIYKGTLGLIGNTPLVEVTNIEKELGLEAKLLVKLEYFNPAGSVKDRVAKAMIEDAEEKGILKEGSESIRCRAGSDRGCQRYEGSNRKSRRACKRDPEQLYPGSVREPGEPGSTQSNDRTGDLE